jgi:hypothetical protein
MEELCSECQTPITKGQPPYVWRDNVVCQACWERFAKCRICKKIIQEEADRRNFKGAQVCATCHASLSYIEGTLGDGTFKDAKMSSLPVSAVPSTPSPRQIQPKSTMPYPTKGFFINSTFLITLGLLLVIVGGICEGAALDILHSGQPGARYDVYPYYLVAIPTLVSGSLMLTIGLIAKGVALGIKEAGKGSASL